MGPSNGTRFRQDVSRAGQERACPLAWGGPGRHLLQQNVILGVDWIHGSMGSVDPSNPWTHWIHASMVSTDPGYHEINMEHMCTMALGIHGILESHGPMVSMDPWIEGCRDYIYGVLEGIF